MKARWPVVLTLIVAAGAFAVLAAGRVGDNLVYYWSPSQLVSAGDKALGASIRLGGHVVPGTLSVNTGETRFDVTDSKTTVHVRTRGVPPQMLREGIAVVVEGTMTPKNVFEGNRLMVSHSNEYKKGEDHP
jgi:cytochrome c-type biogenesis protein CcmE